jgi:WD40 repeat protein
MDYVASFRQGLAQRDEHEKQFKTIMAGYNKLLKETAPPDIVHKLKQESVDLLRDQAQFLESTQQLVVFIKEAENYQEEVEFEIKSVKYEITKLEKEIGIHEQEIGALAGELMRRDDEIMRIENSSKIIDEKNVLALENNDALTRDIENLEELISKLTGKNRTKRVKTTPEIKRLFPHNENVTCVKFNTQGSLFATGSEDSTIKIYDAGTYQQFSLLTHSTRSVVAVAFNDHLLMGVSKDNVVRLWNITSGKLAQVFSHKSDVLDCVLLEHRVISSSVDKTLKIWDIHNGICTKTIEYEGSAFHQLKLFNNTMFLVSTESIYQMDMRSMMLEKSPFATRKKILSIDISQNRRYVLVNYKEGMMELVDFKSMKVLTQIKHVDFSNTVCHAKFSPDSSMFACGSTKGTLFVWKTSVISSDPKWMKRICDKLITCLDWNPSNSILICGTGDKQLLVYDI